MDKKEIELIFNNKKYTLQYHTYLGDGVFGETDRPQKRQRKIRIQEKLSERDEFGTYIHEFLHAEFPDISEEAILRSEEDFTIALFDMLHYRRKDGL